MARINKALDELRKTFEACGMDKIDVKRFNHRAGLNLLNMFGEVVDTRVLGRSTYKQLNEMLLLTFFAVLGGANTWVDIAAFGRSSLKWLRKFSPFENGTPSHDQIEYIFGKVDPDQFQSVIIKFLMGNIRHIKKCLGIDTTGDGCFEHWAIDGKEERGTGRSYSEKEGGKIKNIQTLHVWNTTDGACIYSKAIETKTNEIPVAQKFLEEQESLDGVIITFDALHTQRKTVGIISEKGGNYVAGLKGNQAGLEEDAQGYFSDEALAEIKAKGVNYHVDNEKAHSQIEKREYYLVTPEADKERDAKWKGLAAFICCRKTITPVNPSLDETVETRYYMASLTDVDICAEAIRRHWLCESGHWNLDYTFEEDYNTTMNVNAFENLSLVFKLILALLKLLQTTPEYKGCSINTIRKMFSWNPEENCRKLFTFLDKKELSKLFSDANLTDRDKEKISKSLEKMAKDPLAS